MDGWTKIAAGVALGVAGTIYATNKKAREKLPTAARDFPDNVRKRFESAVSAGREASAGRREEILRNLEAHTQNHPPAKPPTAPPAEPSPVVSEDETTINSADDETDSPSPS
ncbi:MAG: hypothetical protein ACR2N0_17130 [Rubrobacteraceae bacterium]